MADTASLPVNFAQLIVSIASGALVHLGETPDPETGATLADLKLARHSIDVLAMLKEKTANNLDEEETQLLDTLLAELRTKYLEASRR